MKTAIANFAAYLQRRYPNSSTSKHYLSDLRIFHQFIGEKSPREITVKIIDAFVEAQYTQKLKPSTINRRISAISSFFEFLIEETEEDTWRNPVCWKRHSMRRGRHLPQDVSDETAEAFMQVVTDPRDRAIFTLMLKAGLRVGEVVVLQVSDLERPGVDNLARLRVRGKGDQERMVWLTWETWQVVAAWRQVRPETESQALFLNQHGWALSVAGVQFRLKQYRRQAQVYLTCHQLRHTFSRRLAEHEMPVDSLSKLLGHRDIQTTQLYIDGADPTVRRDFDQAMQRLAAQPEPEQVADLLPAGTHQAISTAPAEERPDPEAILDQISHLSADLPAWLAQEVRQHTRRRMSRWQPHRVVKNTYFHFNSLRRVCQWLVDQRAWAALEQLQRVDLVAYVQHRQEAGLKPGSIAAELGVFRMFWNDLLDQERVSNAAILKVKAPERGTQLPRYLTAAEWLRLQQVVAQETQADQPDDCLTRAWFYLLAHAGLRASEMLNLRLRDCDLSAKRLRIRGGKGNQDRTVPMTDQLASVLRTYLAVRSVTDTDHLLIYHQAPLKYARMASHVRRFGQKADIQPLTAHRLRHTLATMLVNQGMPITSLQKFLGHQDINMTLIYAKVFDETVRQQFATAMLQIESIAVGNWPPPTAISGEPPMPAPEIMASVKVQEISF